MKKALIAALVASLVIGGYAIAQDARVVSGAPTLDVGIKAPLTQNTSGELRVVSSGSPPTGASATQVQGTAADGAAAVGSPVQTGAVDGSGNAQAILSGTDGRLSINNAQVNGVTISTGTGVMGTGTQRVAIASDNDALTIKQATAANLNAAVSGVDATDAPVSANPVFTGGRASTATPSAVSADGDAVPFWTTRNGAMVVSGPVADGSAATTNPVVIGAIDHSGNTQTIWASTSGSLSIGTSGGNLVDAQAQNTGYQVFNSAGGTGQLHVYPWAFNGSTWDKQRSTGVGNGAAATGLPAATSYGEYLTLANQLALSTGTYSAAQQDSVGNLKTTYGAPAIGNILSGRVTATSTVAAATIVTITAGKSALVKMGASVSCTVAAASATACDAAATFTTVGAGVTPAAGTLWVCDAKGAANAATGTVGAGGNNSCGDHEQWVSCASGTCTVAVATTAAGTSSLIEAWASGVMQ